MLEIQLCIVHESFFFVHESKPIAHAQRVKPVTSVSSTPIVCLHVGLV
jgi:hypothetical protein